MPERYREEWLIAMTHRLRPIFATHGYPIPDDLRISCGWPEGSRGSVLGECWTPRASNDGTTEIFISPRLADVPVVTSVLTHELVHAAVGVEHGHRGAFKQLALRLGLQGPMRTTIPGEALQKRLNALAGELGPYPHAALGGEIRLIHSVPGGPHPSPPGRPVPPPPGSSLRKRQGTRLLKVECPTCGYTVRITRYWIAVGLPVCPCNTRMAESWHR